MKRVGRSEITFLLIFLAPSLHYILKNAVVQSWYRIRIVRGTTVGVEGRLEL